MKKHPPIFLIVFLIQTGHAQTGSIHYFGCVPPADSAVVFAPGIVSLPDRQEYTVVFSPAGDACYLTAAGSDNISRIYMTEYTGDSWSEQNPVPFSGNQNTELSSLSADGNRLYYSKGGDIWMVDRIGDEWRESRRLPYPVNTDFTDAFYSATGDKTGYLYSNRPGDHGENFDIWRVVRTDNRSLRAQSLHSAVNSSNLQVTPCIAPDKSFLIFSQPVDYWFKLFICFLKDDGYWTAPVDMDVTGAGINVLSQNCPTLSPDGEFLFFNRHDQTESGAISNIYWVSTHVIHDIKNRVFGESGHSGVK